MKLTHNLYILMSLISLSFSQVEVWIDMQFGIDLIPKYCEKFADNKQSPQSNSLTTDMMANDLSPTSEGLDQAGVEMNAPEKAESTRSLGLQVSGTFMKCNGSLKEKWKTLSPTAPNIIKINKKEFLFIFYLEEGKESTLPLEVELEDKNMLFTRCIYKSAPHLFTETEVDIKNKQKLVEDFAYANSLMRSEKHDKSVAKHYEILNYLKKSSNNEDLINYIYENLAYTHSYQWFLLENKIEDLQKEINVLLAQNLNRETNTELDKKHVEKNDLQKEKDDVSSSYSTIFEENYLVSNKKTFFNKILHGYYEYFKGDEGKQAEYLKEASQLVGGDLYLAEKLVEDGELYNTIYYINEGLGIKTQQNRFFSKMFISGFEDLKKEMESKMKAVFEPILIKKRRKLKKH
jgi:hypothetical protein